MTRPYRALVMGTALLTAGLAVLAGAPRRAARIPAAADAPHPVLALSLDIVGGAVRPARSFVAKGADLSVRLSNLDRAPRTISLLGYDDLVAPARVGAGDTLRLCFRATRPGSDFAWLVDGRPAGAFVVTGSHLVEGHR